MNCTLSEVSLARLVCGQRDGYLGSLFLFGFPTRIVEKLKHLGLYEGGIGCVRPWPHVWGLTMSPFQMGV